MGPKTSAAIAAVGLMVAVLVLTGSAQAATLPSDGGPTCWFQTNGREVTPDKGDWYTSKLTASSDRRHLFQLFVPAGAAFPVVVRVRDAESTRGPTDQHDEVVDGSDPTRFTLRRPDGTLLARQTFPPGSPRNSVFEAAITAADGAGTYILISETGALPISGNSSPDRNDDQNSFRVQLLGDGASTPTTEDDVRLGFTRTTIACTEPPDGQQTPLTFAYTVPEGATTTVLRNFDLDAPGRVTGPLTYTSPVGDTVAGTMSGEAFWSDDIVPVGANQYGRWTIRIAGLAAKNQVAFEAWAGAEQLPLSVVSRNQPPSWVDPGIVTVGEPAGFDPVPITRSVELHVDEPDDGQTLRLSVPGEGHCGTTTTHPFTSISFGSSSVVSSAGLETAQLQLAVGGRDADTEPHCVRVRVFDGGSARDLELTVGVTAANSAPVAHAGADQIVQEPGTPVTLSGDGSTDPDGDPLAFTWSQVSGPPITSTPSGASLSFQPDVTGIYEFTLTVGDGEFESLDDVRVTVADGAPVVTPPAPRTVPARRRVAISLGSFADPGADGPWTVEVRWGDGKVPTLGEAAAPGSLGTALHKFLWGGVYRVTVIVTDQDGAAGIGRFRVTVKPPCIVPYLKGKTLRAARRALTQRSCRLGLVTRAFSSRVAQGRVISQKPRPTRILPTGAKVAVKISLGPGG